MNQQFLFNLIIIQHEISSIHSFDTKAPAFTTHQIFKFKLGIHCTISQQELASYVQLSFESRTCTPQRHSHLHQTRACIGFPYLLIKPKILMLNVVFVKVTAPALVSKMHVYTQYSIIFTINKKLDKMVINGSINWQLGINCDGV